MRIDVQTAVVEQRRRSRPNRNVLIAIFRDKRDVRVGHFRRDDRNTNPVVATRRKAHFQNFTHDFIAEQNGLSFCDFIRCGKGSGADTRAIRSPKAQRFCSDKRPIISDA
jgi:hypothetical protein